MGWTLTNEYTAEKYGDYSLEVFPDDEAPNEGHWISTTVTFRKDKPPATLNWAGYGAKDVAFARRFSAVLAEATALADQLNHGWKPKVNAGVTSDF